MAGLPSFIWPLTDWLLNARYPWRSRLQPGEGDYSQVWCTPLRVNAIRLGDLALVTFAAETFTEIGMQIKTDSPAPHTLFASVSDGCISYLPTAEAHALGGYEIETAPYPYRFPGRLAPECASIAIRATGELLSGLWKT
jgi:neutral ceramidase